MLVVGGTSWYLNIKSAVLRMTYSKAILHETFYIFIWSFTEMCSDESLAIDWYWFMWWLGTGERSEPYLNNWCPSWRTYICVTWPQLVYSLQLSDAMWRHRAGSTLGQVISHCLMPPIITWTSVKSVRSNNNQGPLLLTWFNFNPSMDK